MLEALTLASLMITPSRIDAALLGSWVGTLEYRDYSDNSRQRLGTLLNVSRDKASGRLVFRYVYDDGPKKVVQESEQLEVDEANSTYTVFPSDKKAPNVYAIEGLKKLKATGFGTIHLFGKATENDAAVEIRETISIGAEKFSILRESKLPGQSFLFRHQFVFTRVNPRK